jgi:putative peptidoglycan lipid II flippase
LAAFVNAGLLYRGLHRAGIYRFNARWLPLMLRFAIANAVMLTALWFVTPNNAWWLAEQGWSRVGWVLLICAAGAGAYAVALLAVGFRPRELRHP